MALTLNAGVIDQLYTTPPPSTRASKKGSKGTVVSTGDVAEWLENKYHPFEVFIEIELSSITKKIEDALSNSLVDLFAGRPPSNNPFSSAESSIENDFKQFISTQQMDGLGIPGIPTKAALEGKSSRFKKGKGPPRPSFVDTGLYVSSAKIWMSF